MKSVSVSMKSLSVTVCQIRFTCSEQYFPMATFVSSISQMNFFLIVDFGCLCLRHVDVESLLLPGLFSCTEALDCFSAFDELVGSCTLVST